jgi:hypothetical protein
MDELRLHANSILAHPIHAFVYIRRDQLGGSFPETVVVSGDDRR